MVDFFKGKSILTNKTTDISALISITVLEVLKTLFLLIHDLSYVINIFKKNTHTFMKQYFDLMTDITFSNIV